MLSLDYLDHLHMGILAQERIFSIIVTDFLISWPSLSSSAEMVAGDVSDRLRSPRRIRTC